MDPRVHYHIPKRPLTLPILRHSNLVNATQFLFLMAHLLFFLHLRLGLPRWLLPSCLPTKILHELHLPPYEPHSRSISVLFVWLLEYFFVRGTNRWYQCSRCLRRRSVAACLLRLFVRNPPLTWVSISCGCCTLSDRGLYDKLITGPEESYRLRCVVVCDLETSRIGRPWPALGCSATKKKSGTSQSKF